MKGTAKEKKALHDWVKSIIPQMLNERLIASGTLSEMLIKYVNQPCWFRVQSNSPISKCDVYMRRVEDPAAMCMDVDDFGTMVNIITLAELVMKLPNIGQDIIDETRKLGVLFVGISQKDGKPLLFSDGSLLLCGSMYTDEELAQLEAETNPILEEMARVCYKNKYNKSVK